MFSQYEIDEHNRIEGRKRTARMGGLTWEELRHARVGTPANPILTMGDCEYHFACDNTCLCPNCDRPAHDTQEKNDRWFGEPGA